MRFSSGDIHCLVLDSREGLQLAAVEPGQPVLVLLEHLVNHVADFAQTAGLDALPRASMKFLLKGTQPIVPVLARRLYKTVPPELREALEAGDCSSSPRARNDTPRGCGISRPPQPNLERREADNFLSHPVFTKNRIEGLSLL